MSSRAQLLPSHALKPHHHKLNAKNTLTALVSTNAALSTPRALTTALHAANQTQQQRYEKPHTSDRHANHRIHIGHMICITAVGDGDGVLGL